MRRQGKLAVLQALGVILVSGCGGDEDRDQAAGGPDGAVVTEDGAPSSGAADSAPGEVPPGADTEEPFPIDRGDDAQTPGTYKGLWLRLVDNGQPTVSDAGGEIGVVCVGMSNGDRECGAYIDELQASLGSQVSDAVTVVNCAVGGHAVEKWNDPALDDNTWDSCVEQKIPQAGLTVDQVRVVWHKAANQFTTGNGGDPLPLYPDAGSDYENFYDNLSTFADRLSTELPSVQAVYTTSRSYGGFANKASRGEPLSYEEGHALNSWLRDHPEVGGVWYGWGPYIWAPDCASGESNGSGICYERDDFASDGIHPAAPGQAKIVEMLHSRFLEEDWYQP